MKHFYRKGVEVTLKAQSITIKIKEAINCSLDYQYYFDPVIEDLRECYIDRIFNDAEMFLENNYYQWLLKYDNKEIK